MGLSGDQKELLMTSWKTLGANTDTMQTNGAALFGLLFKTYPDTRGYFPHFKGVSDDGIKADGVGRAHALAFFTGVGNLISSLNDDQCLKGLALKVSRNHLDRNIGPARFQQMRGVFGQFLVNTLGKEATEDVKAAWDALLAMLQDNLVNEEKKR